MALLLTVLGLAAIMPSPASAATQCWGPYLNYAQAQNVLTQKRDEGYCVDPNLDPQQAYFEVIGAPNANGYYVYWGCCNTYTSILPEPTESLKIEQEQSESSEE